jgi:hypothetical protein
MRKGTMRDREGREDREDREDKDSHPVDGRDPWGQIAKWAATLADEEGLDPKTAARYGRAARRFAAWLHAHHLEGAVAADLTDLASVTVADAQAYREALLADGQAPGAINRALTALRLLFDRGVAGPLPGAVAGAGARMGAEHDAPAASAPNPFRAVPLVPRR